jgi:LysR family transcriptional regulator, nitrogen assimilation regulatory protein
MDFRKLRYFVGVVEARSMSKAADRLHVAQPALSKSLRSLEDDFGAELLKRSPQGVVATEAGLRLYEHCQILFKQVDRARLDVVRAVERPSGLVALGMPHSLMAVLALPLLKAATQELPEVRIELKQEQSHVLAAAARSQKLDFTVVAQPRSSAGLACQPLLIEELFFIEPRLKRRKSIGAPISFAEASGRQYVLPTVGNGLRAYIESQFRARSLSLNVKYEIDAIALISHCVVAGLGASLLPGGCLQHDPVCGDLHARSFAEGGCRRTLVLCRSEEGPLSPACERLMSLVGQVSRELVHAGAWLGARLEG